MSEKSKSEEQEISFSDIERIEGKASEAATNPHSSLVSGAHGACLVDMLGIIARELRRTSVAMEKANDRSELYNSLAHERDKRSEARTQRVDEADLAWMRKKTEYEEASRAFELESMARARKAWADQDEAEKPIEERLAGLRATMDELLAAIHGRVDERDARGDR